jgi:hypothetical protein
MSSCTAKKQYRKFETNIPRKGTVRPQSQFLHSCVSERFMYTYSHDWSAYSAVDQSWEYLNRSQTHEWESIKCANILGLLYVAERNILSPLCLFVIKKIAY